MEAVLVRDLTVRSGLFPFLAALLLLLVVGELARLACTGVGSCLTVEEVLLRVLRGECERGGLLMVLSTVTLCLGGARAEPVSFQGYDLELSHVHFSEVVLAFSVSW
ncbi:hypothetical protein Bca101_051323 [Brassica carinata]